MEGNAYRPVFRVSVLAIMLFQVCALFARSALDISLVKRGMDRAIANDVSYLVVPPILAAFMYPYLRRHWTSLRSLFRPKALTLRLFMLAVILGLLLRVTYWALLTVLIWAGVIGNDDPDAVIGPLLGFDCPPLPVLALSVLTMSLMIPLVEEIINRGFLLHALLPRGVVASVLLSAFLFALAHQPGTYVAAFAAGILLAVQTLNSQSLWPSLITHSTYNLAAIVDWECFQIIWNPTMSDQTLITITKVAAPVAVGGIVLCCWLVCKKAIGTTVPRLPRSHL
ncbi:MAG TPA: type II CAAX endopeptidase family protein [Woeseiaceae bacterium]|nr:type II CAAX endopeptidase family protein [Woeseiaceae bacterium]